MKSKTLITNALIVNEGMQFKGYLLISSELIEAVGSGAFPADIPDDCKVIDAEGLLLIPGVIDCHVHFREPGLTHKADIHSESMAAVAGGTTSYMEMPNTQPPATTLSAIEAKMVTASQKSLANYSFFLGASNDNLEEILKADPATICGVKVFFGASTGNMLVDDMDTLTEIFKNSPLPVAAHCEDEATILANSLKMKEQFGENVPAEMHPQIRTSESCYSSSKLAVSLAKKYNTRLHITHLSTKAELSLLENNIPLSQKRITSEVCTHYLWFSDKDYLRLGMKLKVNPAIKSQEDKEALINGLIDNHIDIISTDHAPHLLSEKANTYFKAPSGTPLVQHSLQAILQLVKTGKLELTQAVDKMCHAPATCYAIEKRGFLRPGYFADLVLVNMDARYKVEKNNILYKCGWSVFEGEIFNAEIVSTFVNGNRVYHDGKINEENKGKRLTFER